ncbi:hypothetical protein [Sinomonas gamaensis]|jgi:hypothetical protein|uniref:hypothetical protein n=1 Tax=Sinomonas gamaensis TaxID=2565624 RepID=UPI0014865139|nr:hypothetical protein [Sinomonas gamaensis]
MKARHLVTARRASAVQPRTSGHTASIDRPLYALPAKTTSPGTTSQQPSAGHPRQGAS